MQSPGGSMTSLGDPKRSHGNSKKFFRYLLRPDKVTWRPTEVTWRPNVITWGLNRATRGPEMSHGCSMVSLLNQMR